MLASAIMLLFLLVAGPLAYVTVVMLFEAHSLPTRITVIPVLKGMFSFAIIWAITAIFSGLYPLYYNPRAIFIHYLFDQTLLPDVLLVACFFLLSRALWQETKVDRFIGLLAFFAGYFTVAGVVDLFTKSYHYSDYRLFLVPAVRVTTMVLLPSAIVAFKEERMFVRYVYLLAGIAGPIIGATIAMLHTTNALTHAYALGIGFFVAGVVGSYAMVRLYLPVRL